MNHIAQMLARSRKSRGLTHQQLAERAGVSRMTVQRMEAGEDVRLHTLLDVLRVLDLDLVMVPEMLRAEVEQFIQAGGRILGQRSGPGGPMSIADRIRQRAEDVE
ncbi:helix-turn-helix transcriptional regulator [Roseateles sp. MS654]|uniref:helix-turn-helix transcriptional regulator n=1 Tax=Roseateles sp. MS654 TaxID=3412685 RepID=UPI003C2B2FD0